MERNKNPIYTITSLAKDEKNTRCFGYFHSLQSSLIAAKEDHCSLSECFYYYLVIESIK